MMKYLYTTLIIIILNICSNNSDGYKTYCISSYLSFDNPPHFEFGNNVKIETIRLLIEARYFRKIDLVKYKDMNIYLYNYHYRLEKFLSESNIENLFILHQIVSEEEERNSILLKIKIICDKTKNSILCIYSKLHEFPWLEKHEIEMYYKITLNRCLSSHLYYCYLFSTYFLAEPKDIERIYKYYNNKLNFLPFREKYNIQTSPENESTSSNKKPTFLKSKEFYDYIFNNDNALNNMYSIYLRSSSDEKDEFVQFLKRTTNFEYYKSIVNNIKGFKSYVSKVKTFLYERHCYNQSLYRKGIHIIDILLYLNKYTNDKTAIVPNIFYLCNTKYGKFAGYCSYFNNLKQNKIYNFSCESSVSNMEKSKYLNTPNWDNPPSDLVYYDELLREKY